MRLKYSLICLVLFNIICIHAKYEVPIALVEAFSPKGFRVSIADETKHRINIFAFHGRINKKLEEREAGQFSKDITQPTNGRWIFEDTKTSLKPGDVIYYWTYVELIMENGSKVGYPLDDQMFTVKELKETRANNINDNLVSTK